MAKPSGKKYNVIDVYNMTLKDFENMCRAYGSSTTLSELAESAKKERPHVCPKCNGKGYETIRYNAYPSGLPDSGWVEDMKDFNKECDLCNGHGRTKDKFVAKPVKVEYVKS
ncbi:hypothetical protein KP27_198 [Klebsiella phage KP27]|uniref:Uncharacterized protein n=1 Tax=Klebsiella phage KP27 TaxID=1129147 RepID=K7NRC2_9CAUD|nr:hypothetical protein KP27_198 [Klebsiella phage KP27]AEX26663.1 hypothetical protein KP27_198 [Klebsiella phage KP27]